MKTFGNIIRDMTGQNRLTEKQVDRVNKLDIRFSTTKKDYLNSPAKQFNEKKFTPITQKPKNLIDKDNREIFYNIIDHYPNSIGVMEKVNKKKPIEVYVTGKGVARHKGYYTDGLYAWDNKGTLAMLNVMNRPVIAGNTLFHEFRHAQQNRGMAPIHIHSTHGKFDVMRKSVSDKEYDKWKKQPEEKDAEKYAQKQLVLGAKQAVPPHKDEIIHEKDRVRYVINMEDGRQLDLRRPQKIERDKKGKNDNLTLPSLHPYGTWNDSMDDPNLLERADDYIKNWESIHKDKNSNNMALYSVKANGEPYLHPEGKIIDKRRGIVLREGTGHGMYTEDKERMPLITVLRFRTEPEERKAIFGTLPKTRIALSGVSTEEEFNTEILTKKKLYEPWKKAILYAQEKENLPDDTGIYTYQQHSYNFHPMMKIADIKTDKTSGNMAIRFGNKPRLFTPAEWEAHKERLNTVTEKHGGEGYILNNPGSRYNQLTKMNTILSEDKHVKRLDRVISVARDDEWHKKYNEEAKEALKGQGYSDDDAETYLGLRSKAIEDIGNELLKEPKIKKILGIDGGEQ